MNKLTRICFAKKAIFCYHHHFIFAFLVQYYKLQSYMSPDKIRRYFL